MTGASNEPDRAEWPPRRIAAGVVAYHPPEPVDPLIDSLASQFDAVFVVENESDRVDDDRVVRIRNLGNRGLARAVNQVCDAARQAGFGWAILFDQDSRVPTDFRSGLDACVARIDDPPALLAANYRSRVAGQRVIGYRGGDEPVVPVVAALNSGSLLDLGVHARVGGHDERFFVDHVDHDYCLRLRSNGYRVLATAAPLFEHRVGPVVAVRRLGRVWQSTGHPASRRAGWAEGLGRLVRSHWRAEPAWCARMLLLHYPRELGAMLVLETDRMRKCQAMITGLFRGLFRPGARSR